MKKVLLLMLILGLISLAVLVGCSSSTNTEPHEGEQEGQTEEGTEENVEDEEEIDLENMVFKDAPFFADKDLPPVEERLPKEPKLTNENPAEWYEGGALEIGKYGGTLRMVSPDINFNPDLFIMLNEGLLNTPGILGEEVTPNIVSSYDVSSDQKEFTFTLREGLKWSDGMPVSTEDILFTYEDFLLNEELTPTFPALFRAGGTLDGDPMELEVVDQYTFKMKFDEPYGGLLLRIAIRGWVGYTDILKPKHYLKQFHPTYTSMDELEPLIQEAGFEEGEWWNLFHEKDVLNWSNTNEKAIGFPSLQPWIMVESSEMQVEFERNPYYFKVDAAGNQLPYIDKIQSSLVLDKETEVMRMIAGDVDAANGILPNMALYRENEGNGFTARLFEMHVTPADVFLNLTYDDPIWREVVHNVKFRQALNMAIDREEIIDAIYLGHAELPTNVPSEYDPQRAEEILDEIGLDQRDREGFRLGPDGQTFLVPFEVAPHDPDMILVAELITQFWNDIGVKTTMKQIDGALWSTRNAANELQATINWVHTPLWYYGDLGTGIWAPQWNLWNTSGGENGEEPPEDVKEFYRLMTSTAISLPEQARADFDKTIELLHENIYYMNLVDNAKNPYIWNSKLRNIPTQGFAITNSFSAEQVYYAE